MIRISIVLLLILCSCAGTSVQNDSLLSFVMVHDSAKEKKTAQDLREVLQSQRLESFYFSRRVVVDEGIDLDPVVSPNAYMGTQYENKDFLLPEFLRRQFHVFLVARQAQVKDATAVIQKVLPPLPLGAPRGLKTQEDNTFAVITGYLEFRVLKNVLGAPLARALLIKRNYLPEIYESVFANEQALERILAPRELIPEE